MGDQVEVDPGRVIAALRAQQGEAMWTLALMTARAEAAEERVRELEAVNSGDVS